MDPVSQNGRRKPRPWTAQEQTTLEVATACGVSLNMLAKCINRPPGTLWNKIGVGASPDRKKAKSELSKAWYAVNRQRRLAVGKAWAAANRQRKRNVSKAWYLANRQRRLAVGKAWDAANPRRRSAYSKAWHQSNRELKKARSKLWYAANRERKLAIAKAWDAANCKRRKEIQRRRNARMRIARRFIQISYEQKQQRFALWSSRCAYCGVAGNMTADHVLPIKHCGIDEPSNIAPACRPCNSSKQASPVESWYRAQPFFTEARWRKIQRHCPAAVAGQLPLALPV